MERNNNKSRTKLQTPDGVDLFPPGGSKGSKASVAWTYGGLKKDDKGNILKDTIYCSLCPKTFKYHSSPSNLTDHLNSKHVEAMMELEVTKKQSQAKLTDFKFLKKSSTEKYKALHPKQQQFRADLQDWIVKDKRPFAIVGDMGLKKVVANLDAKLILPHRTMITKDIAASYVKNRKIQTEKFKNVDSFACTNDGGTSLGNSSFIAMTVHWIDDSFESKKKMIDMKPIEGKTAQEYRQAVDDSLEKHGIKAKTFSFTTDNEPTMLKSFSAADRSGCFAHKESKASQKALDSSKVLKKVRQKLRKISTKSNKSPKFKRSIKKEQIERRIRSITLKQEIATRFTSTKIMFNSFLPSNQDEEIDTKEAKENIEAINAALKMCVPKKKFQLLAITEKDVSVMTNILPTLKILEEGITKIGGEKFSTGSLVLPFLSKFLVFLDGDDDDPIYVRQFKQKLQEEMITRCRDNLNMEVLALASFCDMRYSHLKFLDILKQYKVTSLSKKDVVEEFLMELERNETDDDDYVAVSLEPKKKKQKKSFLDDDDDDDGGNKSVKSQLDEYMQEVKVKGCAGAWWNLNKTKYPAIAKLAKKYLAVQGTSTPAERVMSDMGTILNKKRLAMSDENFRMLMYLGDISKSYLCANKYILKILIVLHSNVM